MIRIWTALALSVLLLLFGTAAYANSPMPSPYDLDIAVNDHSSIKSIAFLGSADSKEYNDVSVAYDPERTRRFNERIVTFDSYYNDGGYQSFKLQVTFLDGSMAESNPVAVEEWGTYAYDVKTNTLRQAEITSRRINALGNIAAAILLGGPLLVTLLVEWLISLAFHLKPGKYVPRINLLTNPLMNILILVIFHYLYLSYYLIVLLLEIAVAAVEFAYYKRKYTQHSKRRLLLFTLVANLGSWGVYSLLTSLFPRFIW